MVESAMDAVEEALEKQKESNPRFFPSEEVFNLKIVDAYTRGIAIFAMLGKVKDFCKAAIFWTLCSASAILRRIHLKYEN